jgi:hypothetical protein
VFVNKRVMNVIVVILSVCYVDLCCATVFQGQTHLVFGEKRKWKKLAKEWE